MNEETIEKLINRITEEDGKIDSYVKKQIKIAFDIYPKANEKLTLLQKATQKLENLPTENNDDVYIMIAAKKIGKLKKYLLRLEEVIKTTKPEERAEIMTRAIGYAKVMERFKMLKPKDQNLISELFLKLFLSVPPTKVTTGTLPNLNQEKIVDGSSDQVLDEIGIEIEEHYKSVANLPLPVPDDVSKNSREKLLYLKNRLNKVLVKNKTIQNKKNEFQRIIASILRSLEQTNHDIHTLVAVETEMSEIVETNEDFVKKKFSLESLLQRIKEIDSIHKEINTKAVKTVTRIKGYIIVEGMIYLRHKLEVIEDYRSYVRQFAYPKHINMYDVKKNEIESLLNLSSCSAEENRLYKTRINIIRNRVQEVLTLLEKKTDQNETTISNLEKLNKIKQEITDNVEHTLTSLEIMSDYRNQIQAIEDFSFRVVELKRTVLQQLNQIEMNIYNNLFPDIAPTIEEHLQNYELLTQQLSLNKSGKLITNEEITKWRTAMKKFIQDKIPQQNIEKLQRLFDSFFVQMEQLRIKKDQLDKLVEEMNSICSNLEELSKSSNSNTEKVNKLRTLENKINLLNKDITREDLLKKKLHIEVQVVTERAKIKINNKIIASVKQLADKVEILHFSELNAITFTEDVLILKERVEDLPEGDVELDSQKKLVLEELHFLLCSVDQPLADFSFKKRKLDNVLNVEHYFSKFEYDDILDKETVDFVRRIYSQAKNFEKIIECFLGSRTSVDYYIIDENLLRCLDELNELKCDDEILLDETVKTMTYIKRLKSLLLDNAFCID